VEQGNSAQFVEKARALAIGVAREYSPDRLYRIRIDNWFGPKWMHFAGKFSAGKHAYLGVHKIRLHVPPFVPHRVIGQRVFVGPDYEETVVTPPLHIECPSKEAFCGELKMSIRTPRLYGSVVRPKNRDAVLRWYICRLPSRRQTMAGSASAAPERFTLASFSAKRGGKPRCCAEFRERKRRISRNSVLRRRHPHNAVALVLAMQMRDADAR